MFTGTQLLILAGILCGAAIVIEVIHSVYKLLDTSFMILGTVVTDSDDYVDNIDNVDIDEDNELDDATTCNCQNN